MTVNNNKVHKKKNRQTLLKKHLLLTLFSVAFGTTSAQAELYFSAKIAGPVTNVFSVNQQGDIDKITKNHRWRDLEHNVSPQGLISFSSNRASKEKTRQPNKKENFHIFILDPANNKLSQISKLNGQEKRPKFSTNGKQLAFIRSVANQHSLIIYDLANKSEKTLLTTNDIYDFSWHPVTQKIAVTTSNKQDAKIITIDLATSTNKLLITTPLVKKQQENYLYTAINWSPDGKKLAYIIHPLHKKQTRSVNLFDVDKQQHQQLSPIHIQAQAPISWSKNSDKLLYSALVNYQQYYDENIHKKVYQGGMHIFTSDLLGNHQQITQGDYLFKHPIFSPKEDKIAYLYAEQLNARTLTLKTMTINGKERKTLHPSVAKQATLQWQ